MSNKTTVEAESEVDIEEVKKRSTQGAVALIGRTLFLQVITLISTFLLTIFLSPQEYGVFFVVSAVVNFLIYFSDIGLAAALIQKKDEIDQDDLATTFTIQQSLVITSVLITLWGSKLISGFYGLSPQGLALFRALVVAFFLSSLKTIPSIIMERKLQFNKLVIPQVVENLVFYLTAVYLAWKGYGLNSFTLAVMLRGISGVVVVYLLEPWKPAFALKRNSAKQLLSFGVPFQANSILALVKDDLLTAYLGRVLSLSEVGFIGWAQRWALTPLRFFSDSIVKVTFPAYSRIQQEKETLRKAIETSIFATASVVFPAVIGLVTIAPSLVDLIPRYEKWQPALISLTLFGINAMWASITTMLTNTLNATGYIKKSLLLMVMWTSLTWILTPLFIKLFGFNGVGLASALTAFSSAYAIVLVKRLVPISALTNVTPALIASLLMGACVYTLSPILAGSYIGLLAVMGIAIIVYTILMLLFARHKMVVELVRIKKYIFKP
jgi:O-antigen/teichoic acid export membrane protein